MAELVDKFNFGVVHGQQLKVSLSDMHEVRIVAHGNGGASVTFHCSGGLLHTKEFVSKLEAFRWFGEATENALGF